MRAPGKAPSDQDLADVHAVYRALEARPLERDCTRRTECCQFKLTGRTPYLTRGEAAVLARGLRATGRTGVPSRDDGACPLLDREGRCLAYSARPFGCRTHFCEAAGGSYPRGHVLDLIRRLEAVDQALGGHGSLPLPTALERALRDLR